VAPPPDAELRIRPATAMDIGTVMGFVRELADFERAPEDVITTAKGLRLLAAGKRVTKGGAIASEHIDQDGASASDAVVPGANTDDDRDFMLPGDAEDSMVGLAFSSGIFHVMVAEAMMGLDAATAAETSSSGPGTDTAV